MGARSFYLSARRFSTASGECDRHPPSSHRSEFKQRVTRDRLAGFGRAR